MAATSAEVHRRVEQRIRELCRKRRLAVTHLPDRAAVSRSHFWNIMGGRKSPTLEWLLKIANALEVDIADLLARDR